MGPPWTGPRKLCTIPGEYSLLSEERKLAEKFLHIQEKQAMSLLTVHRIGCSAVVSNKGVKQTTARNTGTRWK